jgi:hypothetical protein
MKRLAGCLVLVPGIVITAVGVVTLMKSGICVGLVIGMICVGIGDAS